MNTPPLSEADAARVAAIHAEREAIWRRDRGCGLDAPDEVKLDRLMRELQTIRDRQYGIVREPIERAPLPDPRKKKRKPLSRRASRNLCKCDLERFKGELGNGAFDASGRLVDVPAPRPPRMPMAKNVYQLCATCQLPPLFEHAKRWGKSPAEYVGVWHGFEMTDAEREYLEWAFGLFQNSPKGTT